MSKVVKGVKKVFKKVAKVVKKVAPVALAVGALVFTGGAALGVGSMAGGWGAAASTMAGKLGLGSTLTSALTGAVTQAGYGALAGGVMSELSGGDFMDGATRGAMAGAVTGGVMGGLGMQTDPLAGIGENPGANVAGGANTGGMSATQEAAAGGVNFNLEEGLAATSAPGKGGGGLLSQGGAGAGAGGGGGGSGFLGEGGWLERNQTLAGNVIKGVGGGLMAGSEADSQMALERERAKLTRENYAGANPAEQYRKLSDANQNQTPAQRFDRPIYGDFEYQYNRESGRIERVPRQRMA